MGSISAYLERQPRWVLFAGSLVLVAVVALLDYFTGAELSFVLFYFAPITLAAWFAGRRAGLVVAGASTVAWTLAMITSSSVNWDTLAPYWNVAVWMVTFLLVAQILAVLRAALTYEKGLARTDQITGMCNARAFYELSEQEIARLRRYRHPFTVAFMDVDNFKGVNDQFGHHAGDELLRLIASTIQRDLRDTDIVARLGGDEFALLLPETSQDSARRVVERMRNNLLHVVFKGKWPVTFSVGAVTCTTPPDSVDGLIKLADALMYDVKTGGKNSIRYEVYAQSNPAA